MRRAKAKSSSKKTKDAAGAGLVGRKAVDLGAVREKIASMVSHEAVQMVKTTMGEVDKGHYAAMKYLFEMVGLFEEKAPAALEAVDHSLARTLLRRLGLPEEPEMETGVTKDSELEKGLATDAVE